MDSQQLYKRSRADKGIGRMILLSLVLHVGVIAGMVIASGQRQVAPVTPKAYTVSLVDPMDLAALGGGGLAPGRKKAVAQRPKIPLQPDKKAATPPQILPQAKEQPKEQPKAKPVKTVKKTPPPLKAVKAKPVETVEKTPPPPKAVKAKPEPKKEVVKLAKKSAKKIAEKEKPKEEKKLKSKKVEKKDKPTIEKAKKKPEKKLARKPLEDKLVKKPAPTPKKTLKKADPPISDTERDEQRLSAAIERIRKKKADPPISDTERDEQRLSTAIERVRKQVESNSKQSGQTATTQQARGNSTSGGSNEGVQGLAFMMYTEQVKQRVKESWIVTQKKSGLTAVVEFGVMPSGDIVAVELAQSSGNNAFDQSVLRAVYKANPLPPPPQEYQQEFLSQRVKVAFGK